jgi:hypothetical protein
MLLHMNWLHSQRVSQYQVACQLVLPTAHSRAHKLSEAPVVDDARLNFARARDLENLVHLVVLVQKHACVYVSRNIKLPP